MWVFFGFFFLCFPRIARPFEGRKTRYGSYLIGFLLAGDVKESKGEFYLAFIFTDCFLFFFCLQQGLLRTDPVPEEGEDVAATIGAAETLTEEEREELRRELAKVEEPSWELRFALRICSHRFSQAPGGSL